MRILIVALLLRYPSAVHPPSTHFSSKVRNLTALSAAKLVDVRLVRQLNVSSMFSSSPEVTHIVDWTFVHAQDQGAVSILGDSQHPKAIGTLVVTLFFDPTP